MSRAFEQIQRDASVSQLVADSQLAAVEDLKFLVKSLKAKGFSPMNTYSNGVLTLTLDLTTVAFKTSSPLVHPLADADSVSVG